MIEILNRVITSQFWVIQHILDEREWVVIDPMILPSLSVDSPDNRVDYVVRCLIGETVVRELDEPYAVIEHGMESLVE